VEHILQTLIVAVIVIVSAVLATWRLTPARAKLRALESLKARDDNAVGRWLLRLRKGVVEELAHGCNACSKSSDHVQKHAAPTKR
jgi:hypothetical protein